MVKEIVSNQPNLTIQLFILTLKLIEYRISIASLKACSHQAL